MTWRVFSVCVAIGVWPPWPFGKTDLFMVGFSELVFRLSTTSPSQNYKNWRAIKMNCISQNMFNVWIFDPKSIWIIKQLVHNSQCFLLKITAETRTKCKLPNIMTYIWLSRQKLIIRARLGFRVFLVRPLLQYPLLISTYVFYTDFLWPC